MKVGRTYWKLQEWIAPGLANSQYIYRDVLLKQLANRPRWLDLGCGSGALALENGYIKTDEDMRTEIPGVFAAGDIRVKSLRQVVTAASDGAIAATQAERYLSGLE